MKQKSPEIDRSGLPEDFLVKERAKSNLILEANLLKHQGLYEAAAAKFASAAALEDQLAARLLSVGKTDKAFFHQFSALSCWAQAGDLHRAITLAQQLIQQGHLSTPQNQRVAEYLNTLQQRLTEWMSQWVPEPVMASD